MAFWQISYHGEEACVAFSDTERALPLIRMMLKNYNLDDIYNAEEFGLQYGLAPNKTIAATQLRDIKKHKARITCLSCCNASGRDSLPLRKIGNARSRHGFRGKVGRSLHSTTEIKPRLGWEGHFFLGGCNYSIRGWLGKGGKIFCFWTISRHMELRQTWTHRACPIRRLFSFVRIPHPSCSHAMLEL